MARKLQRKLQSEGLPCVVVNQDMFLANTRGNCTLCVSAICNYNVINELDLADKIKQAQDDVDSQQNTSAEKRAVVSIEGSNLLAIPWMVSLVDLTVWIKVPLRRCALNRVTRKAGFKWGSQTQCCENPSSTKR